MQKKKTVRYYFKNFIDIKLVRPDCEPLLPLRAAALSGRCPKRWKKRTKKKRNKNLKHKKDEGIKSAKSTGDVQDKNVKKGAGLENGLSFFLILLEREF